MADVNAAVNLIFKAVDFTAGVIEGVKLGFADIKQAADLADAAFDHVGVSLKDIGDGGLDKTTASVKSLKDATSQAATEAEKAETKLKGVASTEEQLQKVVNVMKAIAASLVVKEFIDANVPVEKFISNMTALTGDSSTARKELEYMNEVTGKFGIVTSEILTPYSRFVAGLKDSKLEAADAKTIFEGFAGTVAALGGSTQNITSIFTQLEQGISKGKFELSDLKVIANNIPGFFDAFARSLDVTTEALFGMITKGEIGGQQILAFAKILQENLGSQSFDLYENKLARLKNSIGDFFLNVGNAGAFDALKALVDDATFGTTLVGRFVALNSAMAEVNKQNELFSPSTWFGGDAGRERVQGMARDFLEAAGVLTKGSGLNESLAETNRFLEKNAQAAENIKIGEALQVAANESQAETNRLVEMAGRTDAAYQELDKTLKGLGLDPFKIEGDLSKVAQLFDDLVRNAKASGEDIARGLTAAIGKVKDSGDLIDLFDSLDKAFKDGKISEDQYVISTAELVDAFDKLDAGGKGVKSSVDAVAKAAKDAAKEAAEAADKAEKFRLEMEKLASNERIKVIEAKVKLDIANVEANAKIVEAIFKSLDTTITSTGDVIGKALGGLKDFGQLDSIARNILVDQINLENQRRQEALDLQKSLTNAQINVLNAQAKALNNQEALIKIDGAGLQPHLEAFMWEILKQVQIKASKDGVAFLLGLKT